MDRRTTARTSIHCRIVCEAGPQSFAAEGVDLGERGIAFNTTQELPLNAEVVLRYRLDDDGPTITARVRICRLDSGRYFAEFLARKTEDPTSAR